MLSRINMHISQLFLVLFLLLMLPCFDSKGGLTPLPTNIPLRIVVTPAIATLYTEPHDWAYFEQVVSVFGNGQFDGGFADLLQVSCTSTGALQNIAIDPPASINQEPALISSFVLKPVFWNCSSVNISIGYQGQLRVPPHNLSILISQQEMPVLEWEICKERGTVEFFMVPKYGDYSNVHFEDLVLQMDSVEGECGNFLVWEAASWSFSSVPAKRQRIAKWKVPETGEWTGTLDFMAVQKGTYQLRSQVYAFIQARASCSSESEENIECQKNSECSVSECISIPEFVIPEFSLELQEDLIEERPNPCNDSGIEYESDSSNSSKKMEELEITPFLEWSEVDQSVKVVPQQSTKGHCAFGTLDQITPRPIEEISLKKHKVPKKQRTRVKEPSKDSIALGLFEGQSNSTEESFGIEEEPLGFIDPDWRHSTQQDNNNQKQKQIPNETAKHLHDLAGESTSDSGAESGHESPQPLHKLTRPKANKEKYFEWSVRDSDYQHLTETKSSNSDSTQQTGAEASNRTLRSTKKLPLTKKVHFEEPEPIEAFRAAKSKQRKQSTVNDQKQDALKNHQKESANPTKHKESANSSKHKESANSTKHKKQGANSSNQNLHPTKQGTKATHRNSNSVFNDSYFTFSESSAHSSAKIPFLLSSILILVFIVL